MGTYQLRFIFGIVLSEASLKCTRNFFKNSLRENNKHLRPEVQATLIQLYFKLILLL